MRVLSLFDGMGGAIQALKESGIKIEKYYASEIDKFAIKIAKKNHPEIIHLGDVTKITPDMVGEIDLLVGGSPCQGFSFAGKQLNFEDERSVLFFEYVRLLKELKPKYFLLENVVMKKQFQDVISEQVGVEPIMINSALLTAQNRKRLYWTNIKEKPYTFFRGKSAIKQPTDQGVLLKDILDDIEYNRVVINPVGNEKNVLCNVNPSGKGQGGKVYDSLSSKSPTLTTNKGDGIKIGHKKEYSNKCILAGMATLKGHDYINRVYSENGKSPTLCASSGGHTEPKVQIVQDGRCGTNWFQHKTYLEKDGLYWRKLTPVECERLQGFPDNYTEGVSNSQRYKMLGNGFTVPVISYILSHMGGQE